MRIAEIVPVFDLEPIGPDNNAYETGVNQGSVSLDARQG